jgi:phosphoribosyl-AMP cyclohydrolase
MNALEEGTELSLDFGKLAAAVSKVPSLLPAVVQEKDGPVLVLGYVNEEALRRTLETGYVTFWSTSRNELWVKGDTSGNRLKLLEARVNCEQNSLLFIVNLEGQGACHTKEAGIYRRSCYYRSITADGLTRVSQ